MATGTVKRAIITSTNSVNLESGIMRRVSGTFSLMGAYFLGDQFHDYLRAIEINDKNALIRFCQP